MPEWFTGPAWAFGSGMAAPSGVLGGTMLGLVAQIPHRAIAAEELAYLISHLHIQQASAAPEMARLPTPIKIASNRTAIRVLHS